MTKAACVLIIAGFTRFSLALECSFCEPNEALVPKLTDMPPSESIPDESCSMFQWQMQNSGLTETACGFIKMHAEDLCICQPAPLESCSPCDDGTEIVVSDDDSFGLCLSLKELAENTRDLDTESCNNLKVAVADNCECSSTAFEVSETDSPTESPVASPTSSPVSAPTESPVSVPIESLMDEYTCRPCTNPAHDIVVTGDPLELCDALKETAIAEGIDDDTCLVLQTTVAINCVCRPPGDFEEKGALVASPTSSPVSLSPVAADPSVVAPCNLCGENDLEILLPEGDVLSECYTLKNAGVEEATSEVCQVLQEYVTDIGCQCGDPFAESQVTSVPSDSPSLTPVSWSSSPPSDTPSMIPSDAPSSIPSSAPNSATFTSTFGDNPICNLCGEEGIIGKPDGVPITGAPQTTCADLQASGEAGRYPEAVCTQLQLLAKTTCQCSIPSDVPSYLPSQAPNSSTFTSGSSTTLGDNPICNLCGEDGIIGKPDGVPIMGAPQTTCAVLQASGEAGRLPESVCTQLQLLAKTTCQCRASSQSCVALLHECMVGDECCDENATCLGICAPLVIAEEEPDKLFPGGPRPGETRRVRGLRK